MTRSGGDGPVLSASVELLDHHDLHLVVVIGSVEERDAGVVAQAWALLGVLDLS